MNPFLPRSLPALLFLFALGGIDILELKSEPAQFSAGPPPTPHFRVSDFGAIADEKRDATSAIQAAIDACAGSGGSVIVGAGTYLTGQLRLGSKMTFFLEEEAILKAFPDRTKFPEVIPDYESRTLLHCRRSLLYAIGAEELTISGYGTLDGDGANDELWTNKRPGGSRAELKTGERALLIRLFRCEDINVSGIRLKDCPTWAMVLDQCRDAVVEHLLVDNIVRVNGDGIDVCDSQRVVIRHNRLRTDDDAICLKSMSAVGIDDVKIHDNLIVATGCNGIKLGTDTTGPVSNLEIKRNRVYYCGLAALAIESVDGSIVRNVEVEDLEAHQTAVPLFIRLGSRDREAISKGAIDSVRIRGLRAFQSNLSIGCAIAGTSERPIGEVSIIDSRLEMRGGLEERPVFVDEKADAYPECNMFGMLPAYGIYARHVGRLTLENVEVVHLRPDVRPWLDTVQTTVESVDCKDSGVQPTTAEPLSIPLWFPWPKRFHGAILDDGDPVAEFDSNWRKLNSPDYFRSTSHRADRNGATMEFTFEGTAAHVIGPRGRAYGQADLFLDGELVQTIDAYAKIRQQQGILASVTGLSTGTHTLRLVCTGERNPKATGRFIQIDAFEVN